MNQERQCGFVGPMKVLNYVQVRTGSSRATHRVGNALEKMTTLLRRRQFQWLRNIGENSPKAWCDLGQFSRIFPHPPTEIVKARRLSEVAFNDLREREKGNQFVSFVTMPDQVSEADARCVLRHLHRETALAYAGSASQHDDRAVTSYRAIDCRAVHAQFSFPSRKSGPFRERKWRDLEYCRRALRM